MAGLQARAIAEGDAFWPHSTKNLASMGATRAIIAIEHSMANSWQGIFEPKENHATGKGRPIAADKGEYQSDVPVVVRYLPGQKRTIAERRKEVLEDLRREAI